MAAQEPWTLFYDADCGFCKWALSGVLAWDRRERLMPVALQSDRARAALSDLTPEQRMASVHLLAPDGTRHAAGAAMAPLFRLLPGGALLALGFARAPRLTSRAYEWVARHRSQLSKAVPGAVKRRAGARVRRVEAERGGAPGTI
jgi:predicted DCC family thiol-disulfide oxidoreductase YuxK